MQYHFHIAIISPPEKWRSPEGQKARASLLLLIWNRKLQALQHRCQFQPLLRDENLAQFLAGLLESARNALAPALRHGWQFRKKLAWEQACSSSILWLIRKDTLRYFANFATDTASRHQSCISIHLWRTLSVFLRRTFQVSLHRFGTGKGLQIFLDLVCSGKQYKA